MRPGLNVKKQNTAKTQAASILSTVFFFTTLHYTPFGGFFMTLRQVLSANGDISGFVETDLRVSNNRATT
jgi:hypothetical protein